MAGGDTHTGVAVCVLAFVLLESSLSLVFPQKNTPDILFFQFLFPRKEQPMSVGLLVKTDGNTSGS